MILQAADKSNANINRRLMGAFRDLVRDLELKELNLIGRKFTWSNDRTQTRIDRAFCTAEWDLMLPNVYLQALSSRVSDHCPLLIVGKDASRRRYTGFRFEAFWPKLAGYNEVVANNWGRELQIINPFLRLHTKLQRTSKALRRWAKGLIGNNKVLLCAAKQLIGILDVVQDYRSLNELEMQFKRDLKAKFLGLTAVEKLRAKQASRLISIRADEANAKLFFLQAKGRQRKNHIHMLETESGTHYLQLEKEKGFFDHFSQHFGQPGHRDNTINWHELGMVRHDLAHLEDPFSEEEVRAVIQELASDKAPGPDGYIGIFFKQSWDIIRDDIMKAADFFYQLHRQHFSKLNSAHLVLIPKKAEARRVGDFRPISLTHSISKLLATRLATELNGLVSRAQSAFIRKRSIQDNFLFTQNMIKEFYRKKQPALFLKLDIAKAFDSLRWDYLMEVLEQMGFGARWRGWVSTLLSTSSTAILLNGSRGQWYKHYTGLRQGDPLSPNRAASLRTSLYADDAAIFLKPVKEDVRVVAEILDLFGKASGLITNQCKSVVYPIRCEDLNVQEIMEDFACPIQNFPCKYLGLPLHTRRLRRVDIQPLIDKVANRIPTWKGRFLNKAGRLKILNTALSSIPTYFLTIFAPTKWGIKRIDKYRWGFLWKGSEDAQGGHCLVCWDKVQRPKKLGGLRVLDLELFSRALRLRWSWFQWSDPDRPWVGSEVHCNDIDKQLFRVSTVVTVGNGKLAKFWESSWIEGKAPRDIAPHLYKLA